MLLLPFLTQLFTKKRQTLYDLMVKTIVIKGKFVNGELTETEDEFTKKWLVFLLPVGLLLVSSLFIVGIPAYYGYMEAEQNQVDAMQDNIQKQPSKIVEQQSSQPQPIGANEAKLIDDNYVFIGSDENSSNHFIEKSSMRPLENDKREIIFKLNMPSIDASSRIKQLIDCKNFKIQTIEGEVFEQQDLKGKGTFVPKTSVNNSKPILRNSLDMKKYAAVCGSSISLSPTFLTGFNLPDTTLAINEAIYGGQQWYRSGEMYRAWFTLGVPLGAKNIDHTKYYNLFNEINCKTSSVKTLLINEFETEPGQMHTSAQYKESFITSGKINNIKNSMNKRIPKTTELAEKAIISYFCVATN